MQGQILTFSVRWVVGLARGVGNFSPLRLVTQPRCAAPRLRQGGGATPSTMVDIKKNGDRGFNFGGGGGFEGTKLTKLPNFCTFVNWYFICYKIFAFFSNGTIFSHFSQIGSTVFKATFCISTFWLQKVKRGLNFWGV